MKLVLPPLEVDDGDPFKNDLFDRKEFGISLINLITRVDEPLVISIDAPWGEGKTSFVKMWQLLLKEKGIENIFFDSFQNDYTNDPYIALTSEIIAKLEEHDSEIGLKEFKKSAVKAGVQFISWGTKLAIKAGSLGLMKESDFEELSEIKSELAKGASDYLAKCVEEKISSHREVIDTVQSLKNNLEVLAGKIKSKTGKPLLFIIDELDRCKPTYAIELIEKIKHIFSVKNIVFVLVMHKKQLEESIKCVYGNGIDANTYLQKFVNLSCNLPKDSKNSPVSDHSKYCTHLHKAMELNAWDDGIILINVAGFLSNHFDLSLRDMEKAFSYISIFYSSVPKNGLREPGVIALLSILRVKMPQIFNDIKQNKINFKELSEKIDLDLVVKNNNNHPTAVWLTDYLKLCLASENELKAQRDDDTLKEGMHTDWHRCHISRENVLPYFCKKIELFQV